MKISHYQIEWLEEALISMGRMLSVLKASGLTKQAKKALHFAIMKQANHVVGMCQDYFPTFAEKEPPDA